MRGSFWTNTVWYILLFIPTVIMAAVSLAKADNRPFIAAFTAALVGLFYLFEYVLVAVADAYAYYPHITPGDPFQDTVFGNIFSQTSIAAACVLIIVFRLKAWWYFVIAAAYYLIELAFLWLGIYEQHWYRTIFTPVILVPLFWAVRRWHNRVSVSRSRESENALLFLGLAALFSNAVRLPMKLTRVLVFTGHFFSDPSRDHTTTALLYAIFFFSALIAVYRSGARLYWKAAMLAGVYLVQYAAFKAGLMTFREGWFVWATLLEIAASMLMIRVLDRLIRTRRPTADGRARPP